MQQNMYRMSGQVQAMQQEVRELTQLAQQLHQQHSTHFQQLQGQAMNNNAIYQLAGNEQSSTRLLSYLTDVCTEMNNHLRTISQQMGSTSGGTQGQGMMQQSGGVQSKGNTFMLKQNASMSGQGQQKQAAAGPIATDTTHINHAAVPGMERSMTSLISTPGNNQLNPATNTGMGAFSATSANTGMGTNASGAQMSAGSQNQAPMSATQTNSPGGQSQMIGGSTMDGSSQSINGQSMQNKSNAGASMSAQQSPTSDAEFQDNANEYREEPHYTKYPYNRQTT